MKKNEDRDLDTLFQLLIENNQCSLPLEKIKSDINYIFNYFEKDLPQCNNYYIEEIKNNIRKKHVNDIIISMMIINYKYFITFIK